jgi:O-antigen/teichoic acid export membrane protein
VSGGLQSIVTTAGASMPERLTAARTTARRWRGRFLFAFADQGLFSATNFILTILYAAWLPIDDFGRYVVVWTAALFIEAIQTSLIIDALPAISSRYGRRNRRRFDGAAIWVVAGFSIGSSALLVIAAALLAKTFPSYASPILILALVNPAQRFYLFFRRLCYIRDRQRVAAAAAAAYAAASVCSVLALVALQALSVPAAIAVSGLGAVAAIVVSMLLGVGRAVRSRRSHVIWLAAKIWSASRWLTPAAVMSWLMTWGIFPLIAAIGGPAVAGIVRALQNLLTPVVQFNAALNLALLPRIADNVADRGGGYAQRFARHGTAIFTASALVYCAVIIAAAPVILPMIYRKPEIAAAAALLWPLSLTIICEAARGASSIALLATRRTRIVFLARIAALTAFGCASAALGYFMDYTSILWANVIATAVGAAVVMAAAMKMPAAASVR